MLKRVSDLLHAVDRESRVLDAAEARALRNEIEGHLDAAIMARLEMGATPEEAEREAVAAFGDVRRIVRAMRPDDGLRWFDQHFFVAVGLGWLLLAAIGFLGGAFFSEFSGIVNVVVGILSLALISLVVQESVRARRVQLLPILALFPIFSLLGAIGQAATALPADGFYPAVERESARAGIDQNRERLANSESVLARFEARHAEFDRGGMIAPAAYRLSTSDLTYITAETRADGIEKWATAESWRVENQWIIRECREHIASLTRRLEQPWIATVFGWLGVSAGITAAPTMVTLLLNLFVAFISWLARRLPRRGQTA